MAKARILAVVIIGALLLTVVVPQVAMGDVPAAGPVNLSPANNTENISLTPTFLATSPHADEQYAAWWQCTTVSGDYSESVLVFDTGVDLVHLEQLPLNRGLLQPNTRYYWRVRAQDVYGNWSPWSTEASFKTVVLLKSQTTNSSPVDGATNIDPSHNFEVLYVNPQWDEINATQWQWRTPEGSYSNPLYDSGVVSGSSLQGVYPVGIFGYDKKYYWHARVQDVMGIWSDWSDETSFTVVTNSPPNQPVNVEPVNGATAVSTAPVLKASDFSDPNASAYVALNDSHKASQWQITTTPGSYSSPVYDSGSVTTGLTSIAVPADELAANTKYYWRVRYRDNYDDFDGNEEEHWSAWSAETSFTTRSMSAPVADFSADDTEVTAGVELVTFTDNSTPAGEIIAWSWDFGDGTTENWTTSTRPFNGKITHKYMAGGSQDVKLTVTNAAGTDIEVKTAYIVVHAKPEAGMLISPVAPKARKDVVFTDTSTPTADITSWEWDFGDGKTAEWDAATRQAEQGKITHVYKKAGKYMVTLRVSGDLGESVYNKQVEVTGGGGFHFGLWMVGVALAVLVVIAGAIYLVQSRRTGK